MTLKLIFTASLIGAQHYGESVENKLASLLVAPLGKVLGRIAHLGAVDRTGGQQLLRELVIAL